MFLLLIVFYLVSVYAAFRTGYKYGAPVKEWNRYNPFARPRNEIVPISAKDAEYLKGELEPLKIMFPVEIEPEDPNENIIYVPECLPNCGWFDCEFCRKAAIATHEGFEVVRTLNPLNNDKPWSKQDDIKRLKTVIPELKEMPDRMVEDLYNTWSENFYAAGWLVMSDNTIREFTEYLIKTPLDKYNKCCMDCPNDHEIECKLENQANCPNCNNHS